MLPPIRKENNLTGKRVLLRVDFNVPMDGAQIVDDFKIKESLLTINFLIRQKTKIIIISHIKQGGLRQCAALLSNILHKEIKFLPEYKGFKTEELIANMMNGEIAMIENLRSWADEENDDANFARDLARLADVYVNDAFAVSHRKHASIHAIKKFVPAFSGLLLEKEIASLEKILNPDHPFTIVLGGAKIETKLPLILKLHKKADNILLGGVLATVFLEIDGLEVGISPQPLDVEKLKSVVESKKIITPLDFIVKDKYNLAVLRDALSIKKDDVILDIGPETIKLYAGIIKKSKTVLWNGPMGKFEEKPYRHGTLAVAYSIAAHSQGPAFGVVGGGETVQALQMTTMAEYVDHVSTGGGAMLAYLAGEKMYF